MERNDVANLTRIANYLKVQPGKIEINKEKVNLPHNLKPKVHKYQFNRNRRLFVVRPKTRTLVATQRLYRHWDGKVNWIRLPAVIM